MEQRIRELFEKDKWEIKTLEEIATDIYHGVEIKESMGGQGNVPAIFLRNIYERNITMDVCFSFADEQQIKRKKFAEKGDIIFATRSKTKGTVGKALTYLGEEKCLIDNNIVVLKHSQNPKYLSYALSTFCCRQQITSLSKQALIGAIYMKEIKKIQIPLPPRHIQDQIADYLDRWTELEKELEARKKQYRHYKEKLLTREKEKWEIKSLGEIATEISSGNEITKSQLGTGDYPAIRFKDIYDSNIYIKECSAFVDEQLINHKRYCENGDVLVSCASLTKGTVGRCSTYIGEKCLVGNDIAIIKHNQNPGYLSYVLSTTFCREQIKKLSRAGAVVHIHVPQIKQIQIPLPPLEEQERIVSKLDKFHSLCEDVTQGIPWLINATREQYNHYKEEILKY